MTYETIEKIKKPVLSVVCVVAYLVLFFALLATAHDTTIYQILQG